MFIGNVSSSSPRHLVTIGDLHDYLDYPFTLYALTPLRVTQLRRRGHSLPVTPYVVSLSPDICYLLPRRSHAVTRYPLPFAICCPSSPVPCICFVFVEHVSEFVTLLRPPIGFGHPLRSYAITRYPLRLFVTVTPYAVTSSPFALLPVTALCS